MSFLSVYITHPDKEKAIVLGKLLVSEKLVACVNVIDRVTSIYHWEGKLCEDSEVIMFVKTDQHHYSALEKRIKELHPYTCPCILALEIKEGSADYLNWLQGELKNN